ncbi:MAG: glycosyl hydrolase family 8 [Cytophagaceae bacterium]|jgi:hypothetical protein|nr:glycosyl hydrolase family 8 [Cytophagaceae bacterium]
MKIRLTLVCILSVLTMVFSTLVAQTWPADTIQININSGNPKYPFPQFLEYKEGKTLATHNPIGVPHAEMEKSIREAYRIMMNSTIYTGQSIGTGANQVRYMAYNPPSAPDPGPEPLCSEGDGYALIAAAYLGDKKTFDGLWCRLHDNRLNIVTRYIDCQVTRPNYRYGPYIAGWQQSATAANTNTGDDVNGAPDGDFDIALGLLIAYYQWGEFMGTNDNCGNPISYKKEAINFIKALADTVFFDANTGMNVPNWNPRLDPSGANGYYSGHIGFDGYMKRANTVRDVTNWVYTVPGYTFGGKTMYGRSMGASDDPHTDYMAPAYFRAFATFLEGQQVGTEYAFVINSREQKLRVIGL